jgi:hypothetical protein
LDRGIVAGLETPAIVSGLDDVAVVGEPVEQRGRHLGITKDRRPFAEGEVCGDDDGGSLVELAYEMEEQLSAGLRKRQVAELVEDDEVRARQLRRQPPVPPASSFGLELVDQIDDVVEAAACA